MKIREIMTTDVVTVPPDAPYKTVVELLVHNDVSGLPVVDSSGRLIGIVTEADVVSKSAYGANRKRALALLADIISAREHHWVSKSMGLLAGDIMSAALVVCAPDDDVRTIPRRMLERGVKRVPVVDEGQLVGVVSRRDILGSFARADADIACEVTHVLSAHPNRPDDCYVDATVDNGVVTLTGVVRYARDAPIVMSLVREVPGVIDIVNHVHNREAKPPGATPSWSLG